ncbi:TIGR01777 family protein [Halovibrio salipaludis]|uniref:TIGR01777 family protein n=1 Tax=Halovibrio salipaludis TaxID=2032626 RepID=A0A2A2F8M5_9GAMM|nr:TIGR01777 family oxidoreductase [Halovibrio salipaludis]PAU80923.1 TIGR01777 family protein [Halovibrio salipaludis]
MNQHILITGGTGFIGQLLCHQLHCEGRSLTVLSRREEAEVQRLCGRVQVIHSLDEVATIPTIDAVINLAGEGIAEKRWTQQRKQTLWDSRITFTDELVSQLQRRDALPAAMISGSAVGYYGDQGEADVTEATEPRDEFTHRLCAAWEASATRLSGETRVCLSRTGLVIGRDGGFLQQMLPLFRLGLGGRLGNGRQYMPWIHRQDMVQGLIHLLDSPELSGPFNLTAPEPVTNAEFTRALAQVLNRPACLPVPPVALRLALGEMARLLLTGQKARPARLLESGFVFQYPAVEQALAEAVG